VNKALLPDSVKLSGSFIPHLTEAMSEELENRRRRAAWRASHRGTRELDLMIGRFASARLNDMDVAALSEFERFLAVAEPVLQKWLLAPSAPDAGEFHALVGDVRRFNGLE
jgi:antitoxin CptB